MTAGSTSGGGSAPPESASDADSVVAEREAAEHRGFLIGSGGASIERRIGHDEYDPVGTMLLIAIYAVILGVMWVFMYFIEFLGGDLTVIG
jgi:hypothetical protein